MQQLPPGFVLETPPTTADLPAVIDGPQREPPPQSANQAAMEAARVRTEQLRQQRLEQQIRQSEANPPGQPRAAAGASADRARARAANIEALVGQINRVQDLYDSGLRGQGLGSLLEYLPESLSDTNAQFNSAAAGLAEQGLAAFRVPGVGEQSDNELRQFVQANRPQASDRDVAIEEKLRQLRARVDATRQSMGLPPASWTNQGQGPRGELRFNDELPENTNPLTSEQQRAYDAFVAANPNASPDQLRTFAQQAFGLTLDNAESIAQSRGGGFGSASEATLRPDISDMRSPEAGGIGQTIDAVGRGAADVLSLGFADEIAAAGSTLFGDDTMRLNLARERAIDAYDEENNTAARLGGQVAAGFAIPSRIGAAGSAAGRNALRSGSGLPEARAAARAAGTRQLTREGAVFGAGYGLGSTEGDIGDRLIGAAAEGTVGLVTANALGRVGSGIANRGSSQNALLRQADRQEAAEAANAARELGIDMLPADTGGAFTRRMTGIAQQLPGSVAPITMGARRVATQAEGARNNIAGRVGSVVEPEAAGDAARRGAGAYRRTSGAEGRNLYRRAERLGEGVDVRPTQTMQTIGQLLRSERQVPGGTDALPILEQYARAFESGGPITIEGARGMRSALRDRLMAGNMTPANADRITANIMDAVSQDITASLAAAGRQDAVAAYRKADNFWRQRLDTIREAIEPILGRRGEKSGEQIIQGLQQAGRGYSVRLGRFISALPEEEAGTVRATLISQLGRAAPGAQNAEGSAFSLPVFLTHWNAMQPGARRALFGADTMRSLDQLARVANRSKQAQRFENFSNTGATVGGVAQLGHFYADPISATLSLAAQYGAGRLLASPGFARWLARMPRNNPRAARSYIDRLPALARTNPAVAAEMTGLHQSLTDYIRGREAN